MAVVITTVLHVGAALALMQWRDEEVSDISGSIALELAPEQTAAPPMVYGESPQEEAKRVKEVAEEIPTVAPSPLAPNPEVQVPIREEEKEKPKDQNAPQTPGDPVTTAPPPPEVKLSAISKAPARSILSVHDAMAVATWRKELLSHIDRYKRWPETDRAYHLEGEVTLEFTLDRAGRIVVSHVLHSSGSAVLDDAAMSTLKRATPLPMPPLHASDEALHLTLPIRFQR
jgi:protein TonB